MKQNMMSRCMTILMAALMLIQFTSCSKEEMVEEEVTQAQVMIFKPGYSVKITHKAEYFSSIVADGKELITTGSEKGYLRIPELKDPKVYFTFKKGLTDVSYAFSSLPNLVTIPATLFSTLTNVENMRGVFLDCTRITSIPNGLFANNKRATDFSSTFSGCTSLQSVPANLFDNNRKVTNFFRTFYGCKNLSGESPYTMVNDKKVKLWERHLYPKEFAKPGLYEEAFKDCEQLYDNLFIPQDWK